MIRTLGYTDPQPGEAQPVGIGHGGNFVRTTDEIQALLTPATAAVMLEITEAQLRAGPGPRQVRHMGKVYYRHDDVKSWIQDHLPLSPFRVR